MVSFDRQHTLCRTFTVKGIGVHSGATARMTVRPALAGAGIAFIRTDVKDQDPLILARWSNVVETRLCTVLSNQAGTRVSTVEHILSACAAFGIDNATIEIDGPEVPIMDGSARDFVAAFLAVGVKPQDKPRQVLKVLKPVIYREGDKTAALLPDLESVWAFDIAFDNPVIGHQSFVHILDSHSYRREIADCRTFGFLHEVEALRKAGLARGGSLDNAVVVDGAKVLNPGGLRFADEFVRHKILDAIGDLSLAGMPIQGRYEGVKAGHALNNKLLHTLFAQPGSYEIIQSTFVQHAPCTMSFGTALTA